MSECDPVDEKTVNIIRGKSLVGGATNDDAKVLLQHVDALEKFLDDFEQEVDDAFGTEGWRHAIGLD